MSLCFIFSDNVEKTNGLVIGGSNNSKIPISLNVHNGTEHLQDFDPIQNMRSDDIAKVYSPRVANGEYEAVKEPTHIIDGNTKVINDSKESVTELSLKRPREVKEVKNGHNILRHSELSAFTRYNTTTNATKKGVTSSGFQLDNKSESAKKDLTCDAQSNRFLVYQGINEQVAQAKSGDVPPSGSLDPPRVHHIHHHHHHAHHYNNIKPKDTSSNHVDSGLKALAASAPHCGSSNVLGAAVVGNIENCSLNRSGSGSKHGSNVQNGSSNGVNLERKDGESGGGLIGKSGGGGGSGSGSEVRIDQHKSAQREAALIKFREKRKGRCFKKKIRYHNRKQLAEQRPRVRGQFVKQIGQESSSNAAEDG